LREKIRKSPRKITRIDSRDREIFHSGISLKLNKYGHFEMAYVLRNMSVTVRGKFHQRTLSNSEAKKMIVKVYALIWILGALAAAALYLTGFFTPVVSVLFGFLSFGAVFMGMIGVLPLTEAPHPKGH
jgi:hypothetical protein